MKQGDKKQYIKYFLVWFILIGIMVAACIGKAIYKENQPVVERTNLEAPEERVYDGADLLTPEEEASLRAYIAEKEAIYHMDFVVVTISRPMEGREIPAGDRYDSFSWEFNMMNYADDFWDENCYGYNKGFEGDGSLLLDNRYYSEDSSSQCGEWLSTSGKVYERMSDSDVEKVLNAVDEYYTYHPYEAYIAYIDGVIKTTQPHQFGILDVLGSILVGLIAALIFYACNKKAQNTINTVSVTQYVENGKSNMRHSEDQFLRKHTSSRRIQTNSGGGGGGGGHRSSGGARHGGGGHRH